MPKFNDTTIYGDLTVTGTISFNGSDTNYLTAETEVEGAIKELDTRVKTNADRIDEKQNKLVAGDSITIDESTNVIKVDLNAMSYFDYAGSIYGAKYSLLASAWEHSLTVNVIYRNHYPDGETEGVIIPQGVTSIGSGAFQGWSSNNQPLVIPNSVTSIGEGAFQGWSSNNQPLIIPNSVTSIGDSTFYNWSSVPYVEILAITPPTLIHANAFDEQNDAPIYVPDASVTTYKTATNWVDLADRIFPISDKLVGVDLNTMIYFNFASSIYGAKYNLLVKAWEHSLTVDPLEISENSSSSSPRGKAQYPNGETEGVIIPQGVTNIGNFAFYAWSSNNQPLIIPNSVTRISAGAFISWESNNQPLVIPNSVTSIGSSAFYNWSLVPYIEILAIEPPTLVNTNAFDGQNNAPIYVPDERVDDYKEATNWVDLSDRIFPISDKKNTDIKFWTGSQTEYDSLGEKDENTLYFIEEE